MTHLLYIAVGGAIGALMRYWVSTGVYALVGRGLPWGTLAVNVIGSALMGLFYVLLIERMAASPMWRSLLLIGLFGAFTTFSTFSLETLNLIEDGELARAVINILLSLSLCMTAVWLGVVFGRQL